MRWLYSLLLTLIILLTLPFWFWRFLTTDKYREAWQERFGILPESLSHDLAHHPCFWLHAVSVGEVSAAAGLAARLHETFPDLKVVISTVTRTGRMVARERIPFAHHWIYLPIDLPWFVNKTIALVRPRFLVVMETELWPNLFHALGRLGTPIYLVNGRLSEKSFSHYRLATPFMRAFLQPITLFAMQSEDDAKRMASLTGERERIHVTGNIKYDQAMHLPDEEKMAALRQKLGTEPHDLIWIAASTHPGEEEALLPLFDAVKARFPTLSLILVPRHPHRADEVAKLLGERPFRRFSQCQGNWREPILLVDGVGWLSALYGLSTVAFVGGSLIPHGGQNPLEPAAWRLPILLGPHTFHFRDIVRRLVAGEAVIQVKAAPELLPHLHTLLSNPQTRTMMGEKARKIVEENTGALDRTLSHFQIIRKAQAQPPSFFSYMEGVEQAKGFNKILINTLGFLGNGYGLVQQTRAIAYQKGWLSTHHPGVPVIAVGNLTVGGTGKTPCVVYLAKHLMHLGLRVGVVSRGYGSSGRLKRISDGQSILLTPPEAADEAYLIARSLPGVVVATCPDRKQAMAAVMEQGCDVIVLDDAFQHLAARRDFNLLLLDATLPRGNGRLLPGGILREFPSAAKRADWILLTRASEEQTTTNLFPDKPLSISRHQPTQWRPHDGSPPLPLSAFSGRKVLAFCGIAKPLSFQKSLEELGVIATAWHPYPDHYSFTPEIMDELWQKARDGGAEALVCTEKDAVKIQAQGAWPLYSLEMSLQVIRGEEELLKAVGRVCTPARGDVGQRTT